MGCRKQYIELKQGEVCLEVELSQWVTWLGLVRLDLPQVDHLMSQLYPAHLFASQKNSNPTPPQIGSRAHLIKKNTNFLSFLFKTK